MIDIDGSYGEGGGQIVRTATSLAAVTGKPCRIFNIRAGREKPGLMRQHLFGVRALRDLSEGKLEGDEIGSKEILFFPRTIRAKDLTVELQTAASITMVLQSVLPATLFASSPVKITFSGGATDTSNAPTFDYFRYVFVAMLQKVGIAVHPTLVRRGYYPPGGAQAEVVATPGRPRALSATERGALEHIAIASSASEVLRQRRVAERQADAAEAALTHHGVPIGKTIEYSPSISAGSACCIVAGFEQTLIGADSIGARGKWAEDVGREAASRLSNEIGTSACLDRHMADQILPYLALAEDDSCVSISEITRHVQTNMWAIEKFIDGKFDVQGNTIRWSKRNKKAKDG